MHTNIDLFCWNRQATDGGIRFCFPRPPHPRGFFMKGFVRRCDTAFDAMDHIGLEFLLEAPAGPAGVTVAVEFAEHPPLCLTVHPGENRLLFLPWEDFPVETANRAVWQFITAVTVTGAPLTRAMIRAAKGLTVSCPVRGKNAPAGGQVSYQIQVGNPGDAPVQVAVRQVFAGWESMAAEISPASLCLVPEQQGWVEIRLTLPQTMAPGGHEETRLRFVPDGDGNRAEELRLQTLCTLPHPYLYHDAEGWAGVARKTREHPQFQPAFRRWKADADAWTPTPPLPGVPYCYYTDTETLTMSAAYLYAITGERRYAEKLAQFFRYFTDPENGYPARLRGCHMSYVQEGHFFQHLAIPYDIIHDAGVLTPQDHAAIENTFRIYMSLLDKDIRNGHISNWILSEVLGALYCALSLQDWDQATRFAFGPGGVFRQLACGTFNDGWWHEGSIGYNTWVSSMALHAARALRPFGVDMIHAALPVPYSTEVSSTYACREATPDFAMINRKWGSCHKNALYIKDLFDAVLPFLDWRGVMFGVNDSDEKTIDGVHFGSTYDLAYTYYRDPAYLRVIRSFAEPDPVFGHAELPQIQEDSASRNAFSDNMGIAMLRSQTPGRPQREQIQAVLHYGSHGGAHGHFDITDLLSIMRCGRSLYNPEASWWGYRHFMYKWHVQNSLTKNMVNVDDKMQLPAPSRRLLFYSGQSLQAAAIETVCRWAWPPYGGMDYDDSPGDFPRRLQMNVAWFPIDPDLPYGKITGETEPITQRRVLAVTDDYLVLFDQVAGQQPHQYETTFQLKGLQELTAPLLHNLGHTDHYTTQPASDGQMILDCSWYEAEGGSVARFCNHFAPQGNELQGDRSYHNEPGDLHADLYAVWPSRTTQVTGLTATYIGWPADRDGYNVPLHWRVEGDGATLAQGSFDGWLLGRGMATADLRGVRQLRLVIRQEDVENEKGQPVRTPQSVFWGDAELVLADGSRQPLSSLPFTADNTDPGRGIGQDYAGGRVLLEGRPYPDAIPASPLDHGREGTLLWDLAGLDAVRLEAAVGVDPYPGSEEQRRRFYAVRCPEPVPAARFTTVLEPYESQRMVLCVRADGPDAVVVTLTDGRVQRLEVAGLEEGAPVVTLTETRGGQPVRRESTGATPQTNDSTPS